MNLPAVLVIGSPKNTELADAMFECGLTPVFCETVLAAMVALRKKKFQAVVVDQETTGVDTLELILNIRDVGEYLRIFVLAEKGYATDPCQDRKHVSVINLEGLIHKLTPTTIPMIEASGKKASAHRMSTEGNE